MTTVESLQTLDASGAAHADACYRALAARDARFDGSFFTGVTSTGIYCRPVCKVKTPKQSNCRFFDHAAQAESAGFRPCLRCRSELAPQTSRWSTQDASAMLAHQAARMLDEPEGWGDAAPSVEKLSQRMGVSDRHVRRIFEAQFGVSPLQYLQTRRLLTAKQLLADTNLPITQVALCSGYSSLRRFNAAFVAHYKLNPTQLRRAGNAGSGANAQGIKSSWGFGRRMTWGRCCRLSRSAPWMLLNLHLTTPIPRGLEGHFALKWVEKSILAGCWPSLMRRAASLCCA